MLVAGSDTSELFRALKGKGLVIFSIQGLALMLGFAVQIGLTRWLGLQQYGLYVYVLSIMSVPAAIAKFGQDRVITRYTGRYQVDGNERALLGLNRSSFLFTGFAGMILAALICLWAYVFDVEISWFSYALASLLIPIIAMNQICVASLRSLHKPMLAEGVDKLVRPSILLVIVATALYFGIDGRYTGAIGFQLFAALMALVVGTTFLVTALPKRNSQVPDMRDIPVWIRAGVPFVYIHLIYAVMGSIGKVMLGNLASMEAVGIYSVAHQISMVATFGFVAIASIALPFLSRLYAAGDMEKLQAALSLSARATAVVTFLSISLIVIFSPFILSVFGPDFTGSRPVLYILLVGSGLNCLCGMVNAMMNFSGNSRYIVNSLTGVLGVNILLNLLLIPMFGAVGAAIATAVSIVVQNLVMLYYVERKLGITPGLINLRLSRRESESTR